MEDSRNALWLHPDAGALQKLPDGARICRAGARTLLQFPSEHPRIAGRSAMTELCTYSGRVMSRQQWPSIPAIGCSCLYLHPCQHLGLQS